MPWATILLLLEKVASLLNGFAAFLHDKQEQKAGAAIEQNAQLKTIVTEQAKANEIQQQVSSAPASSVDDQLQQFTRD